MHKTDIRQNKFERDMTHSFISAYYFQLESSLYVQRYISANSIYVSELDAGHLLPTRPVRCLTRPADIYKISTRSIN
jgi:hypothetical protein